MIVIVVRFDFDDRGKTVIILSACKSVRREPVAPPVALLLGRLTTGPAAADSASGAVAPPSADLTSGSPASPVPRISYRQTAPPHGFAYFQFPPQFAKDLGEFLASASDIMTVVRTSRTDFSSCEIHSEKATHYQAAQRHDDELHARSNPRRSPAPASSFAQSLSRICSIATSRTRYIHTTVLQLLAQVPVRSENHAEGLKVRSRKGLRKREFRACAC